MARIDHDAVLRRYLAGDRGDISAAMRSLPANIDVALATGVVLKLMERDYWLGRLCKHVPERVIRAVLAADVPGATHLFLRLAVPLDGNVIVAWQRALQALLDLDTTYAWGSKQRRAKIQALARDAHMLAAIQGTVAHAEHVQLDMLAVLVADGSAASYDALVAHIGAAFAAKDRRLDMLAQLRTHAVSTPALDALFAELDGALDDRNAASPALALGPVIGVGKVTTLSFHVSLASRRLTRNNVPWVQGSVSVDSRSPSWFDVSVSTVEPDGGGKGTYFSATEVLRDDLGLGRCDAQHTPHWLVGVAQKLDIEWAEFSVWNSNLRGAKRNLITEWLRS